MRLNQVVQAVPPSGIRRFFDIVSQMEDVISLGVGEPDFVTPWRIREAAIYSLEKGRTTYTSNWGLLELRQGSGAFVCIKRRTRSLADHVQAARRRVATLIEDLRDQGLLDDEIRRAFEAELLRPARMVTKR